MANTTEEILAGILKQIELQNVRFQEQSSILSDRLDKLSESVAVLQNSSRKSSRQGSPLSALPSGRLASQEAATPQKAVDMTPGALLALSKTPINLKQKVKFPKRPSSKTSETSEDDKKDRTRRQSAFFRNTEISDNNAAIPYTFRDAPEHNIALKTLTPHSVNNFFLSIRRYENQHRIQLKAVACVSDKMMPVIVHHFADQGLTKYNFYECSNTKLLAFVQQMVRPKSPAEFYREMDNHLSFDSERMPVPSALTFRSFYMRALTYSEEFREYFDFLAMDNTDNIPAVENKPQGLLQLFLSKFPHHFGLLIWQKLRLLKDAHKPQPYTFETFYAHFKKELLRLKDLADSAEEVTAVFGGTEVQKFFRHAFTAIMPMDHDHSSLAAVASNDEADDSENALLYLMAGKHQGSKPNYPSADQKRPSFTPNTAANSGSTTVRACWFLVNGKECLQGPRCRNSHDTRVVSQAREELIAKLQKLKQPGSQAPSAIRPTSIMQNQKFSHMDNKDDPDADTVYRRDAVPFYVPTSAPLAPTSEEEQDPSEEDEDA